MLGLMIIDQKMAILLHMLELDLQQMLVLFCRSYLASNAPMSILLLALAVGFIVYIAFVDIKW